MKLIPILSVLYCLAVASHAKTVPARWYLAEEEDPDFKRFIHVQNKEGGIDLIDLKAGQIELTAELSDVTYYLYTRSNPDAPFIIKEGNISELELSQFDPDPSKICLFITHGWNNDYSSDINRLIKSAALEVADLNIFVVDWNGPANSNYLTAKGAVDEVGRFQADFINGIQRKYHLSGSSFILVGHSLGAHVAGNAGALIESKVDHIVGLDPALPLFTMGNTDNRLDPSDANFVQIIHTCGGYLGFSSSIGHADYFPNGGTSQPGCGLDLVGTCAHGRSYKYFAESVRTGKVFRSTRCSDYESYVEDECQGNVISFMGQLQVDTKASQDYFLTTNDEEPFGQG